MKRRYPLFAGLTALALALAGCSAGASPDSKPSEEKTDQLTMLVTASPSATGLEALAKTYTQKTGVKIDFVEVPTAQLPTKIILAKQSGQATFDLAQFDGFTLPQVAAAGALTPLDDFLAKDKEYDYADFPDGLKNYAKQDGKSYGLPLSTEPFLQWYRTDLYQQLGIEPAKTWDDAISNAKSLKEAGYLGWASAYGPAVSANYYDQMLYSSGGRLLDPKTYKPLLDTDLNKKVMKQFLSLAQYAPSGSLTGASADMINAFSQQQVGQIVAASGWYSNVNDPTKSNVSGKFATTAVPTSDGGKYPAINILNGWLTGISAVSKHQQAAWDFISWALGKDNVQAFVDAGAPPPARISTTSNQKLIEQLPYLPAEGDATKTGTPVPRIPEMGQIIPILSQDTSAMASGQLSLDAGMAKAQDDILNILVQSGRYKG
jgi:ABC-type glycerol-3-phosphate transport system substrate-binding protein